MLLGNAVAHVNAGQLSGCKLCASISLVRALHELKIKLLPQSIAKAIKQLRKKTKTGRLGKDMWSFIYVVVDHVFELYQLRLAPGFRSKFCLS